MVIEQLKENTTKLMNKFVSIFSGLSFQASMLNMVLANMTDNMTINIIALYI
jgi:hypothetical protein